MERAQEEWVFWDRLLALKRWHLALLERILEA